MIQAEIKPSDRRKLLTLARRFPKEARRAHGGLALRMRNQMRKAVATGGGRDGVSSFAPKSDLSKFLTNDRPIGGILSAVKTIVTFKRGETRTIGWISALTPYAEKLQTAETRPWDKVKDKGLRHKLYSIGGRNISNAIFSRPYDRPARNVVEPFTDHWRTRYIPDFRARLDKAIAKAVRK